MRQGILYGVGVGPGDPELMTLKAVRVIREADVIALPAKTKEDCVSWRIARETVGEMEDKEFLYLYMPMTKDKEILKEHHDRGAEQIAAFLKKGKSVAFLTLGDVAVYSTYLYLHKRVAKAGFGAELVSGVPSFCAAAARLGISLAEQKEELHVIPATYGAREALSLSGTKILMKSGKKLGQVKEAILEAGCPAYMVENCGMENEKVYHSAEEIDENAGYYSLLIVKEADHG
ncbi:MAG: precorrin-2 C(20)-methyltransferase [Lachnospiraceae bacterium]|jgi:precorrin-2/cobalt-factor-2 C20-methyltransferase|nr:precorrin-2 C(20)-methyltransferase [Lachnospiraceae bacterium]